MNRFLLICLSLCFFWFSLSSAQTAFPELKAKTLDDVEVTYPQDFSTLYTLVILPIQQDHQVDFTTWEPYLKEISEQRGNLDFVQVLPIGDLNFLLKGIITSAMKKEYDDIVRVRTVPVFQETEPILASFDITDDSQMYIMLVQNGTIIYQTTGVWSEEKASQLEQNFAPVR